MENPNPSYKKVVQDKRRIHVLEIERLERERQVILADLKIVDSQIAAARAYIRELDIHAGVRPDDRRISGQMTIRNMIKKALQDAGRAMTVAELRQAIETIHERSVARSSISPILSRMSEGGEINKDGGGRWSLRTKTP